MASGVACTFRLLRPEDAGAYVELRRSALAAAPLAFAGSPGADACSDPAWVRARLGEPRQVIAGAFAGTEMIGSAGLYRDERPKLAHRATVWGVWVLPACRGQGVGERVMRLALDTARAWTGVRVVCLSVAATGTGALRLYERLGFARWGVEPGVMLVDGVEHDEIHMHLRLDR